MIGPVRETGTRGYCEICGALDRLEDRTIVTRRYSLCGACRTTADRELVTHESVDLRRADS